jgi:hypothetical protein
MKKQKDSKLKILFQTAAAFIGGIVGTDATQNAIAVGHLYDRAITREKGPSVIRYKEQ